MGHFMVASTCTDVCSEILRRNLWPNQESDPCFSRFPATSDMNRGVRLEDLFSHAMWPKIRSPTRVGPHISALAVGFGVSQQQHERVLKQQ